MGQSWKVVQKFHHRHVLDVPDNLDERDSNDNNGEHGESEAYQERSSKDVEITFESMDIEQLNREDVLKKCFIRIVRSHQFVFVGSIFKEIWFSEACLLTYK